MVAQQGDHADGFGLGRPPWQADFVEDELAYLLAARREFVREPGEVSGPLPDRHPGPRAGVEGLPGRGDSRVDIGGLAARRAADDIFGGGADDRETPVTGGRAEFSTDEERVLAAGPHQRPSSITPRMFRPSVMSWYPSLTSSSE